MGQTDFVLTLKQGSQEKALGFTCDGYDPQGVGRLMRCLAQSGLDALYSTLTDIIAASNGLDGD